ncbi:hypothetical protein MVEN_01885800 [Mycena venus]|uniref:G-protein coupled receptors family 2 profile 2 domain-containing protein n=1 Tax=Mycena venus TaxID=2733690 RepID=A0A8H7CKW0_9AGAR|nr:hypothetical protein MVEN_01885800 [Mycena venus]
MANATTPQSEHRDGREHGGYRSGTTIPRQALLSTLLCFVPINEYMVPCHVLERSIQHPRFLGMTFVSTVILKRAQSFRPVAVVTTYDFRFDFLTSQQSLVRYKVFRLIIWLPFCTIPPLASRSPFTLEATGMAYTDGFVWTPALVNLSNQLWAITAMVGAALCGAVLIIIGLVALSPVSRPHLDRVSFRILVWTLVANTVFGITNAIGGKFTGPTWACGFDIWLLQLTLEMSSFLLFCVALNLQLVVVHQLNGQKLEKFYIYGSIIISLCLTVPPYALKQYGWDPLVEDCWYSNDDPKQRLAWQIGTQLFWTLLTVAGEIICTLTVVIYMVRHQVRRSRAVQAGATSNTRSRSGSVGGNDTVSHANLYRSVILRIVLYPIASALINLTSVACVIHATQEDGVKNWTDYRVLLLSDFVYGGRAILYACLAATDPALVRAVRTWLQSHGLLASSSTSQHTHTHSLRGATDSRNVLSVHIELSTVYQDESGIVVDGVPSKFPRSHGYEHDSEDDPGIKFMSTMKPRADIEASPRERELPPLPLPSPTSRMSRIRVQEEGVRRQQVARERDREREEFQRRI